MQKKLLIFVVVVLVLIAALFFVWQKKQAEIKQTNKLASQSSSDNQPQSVILNEPTKKDKITLAPQHIVAIPGSSQVWYEIPEMGIKLLLSRAVAEEIVYEYSGVTDGFVIVNPKTGNLDFGDPKKIESATFFLKKVITFNEECASYQKTQTICSSDNIEFGINKIFGTYHNEMLAFGSNFLKQFKDFYLITGGSRQAERFLEEEQKRFDQTVAPTLPQFPRLIDIKIEAM